MAIAAIATNAPRAPRSRFCAPSSSSMYASAFFRLSWLTAGDTDGSAMEQTTSRYRSSGYCSFTPFSAKNFAAPG